MLALVCAGALSLGPAAASGSPRGTGPDGLPGAPGGGGAAATLARAATATNEAGTTVVAGIAWRSDNTPIPNARLQLRNVKTGKLEGATIADDIGRFRFTGVETGSYVVELVSDGGKILSVGQTFTIAPGDSVSTFVRLASKAPWFQGFFGNAASALSTAAAGLGVTAISPEAKQCASPPGCR
jgi:hypothetical protein